jgi:ribosomal protein S27AE
MSEMQQDQSTVSGRECPHCSDGAMMTYSTRVNQSGTRRIRYQRCSHCEETAKQIIPLSLAPRRRRGRRGGWIGRKY